MGEKRFRRVKKKRVAAKKARSATRFERSALVAATTRTSTRCVRLPPRPFEFLLLEGREEAWAEVRGEGRRLRRGKGCRGRPVSKRPIFWPMAPVEGRRASWAETIRIREDRWGWRRN